jgi:hypothetical protein
MTVAMDGTKFSVEVNVELIGTTQRPILSYDADEQEWEAWLDGRQLHRHPDIHAVEAAVAAALAVTCIPHIESEVMREAELRTRASVPTGPSTLIPWATLQDPLTAEFQAWSHYSFVNANYFLRCYRHCICRDMDPLRFRYILSGYALASCQNRFQTTAAEQINAAIYGLIGQIPYPQSCLCQAADRGLMANDCHVHTANPRHFFGDFDISCTCVQEGI